MPHLHRINKLFMFLVLFKHKIHLKIIENNNKEK